MFVFICSKLNAEQVRELTNLDFTTNDLPETNGTAVHGYAPSLPSQYESYIVDVWYEE